MRFNIMGEFFNDGLIGLYSFLPSAFHRHVDGLFTGGTLDFTLKIFMKRHIDTPLF
jgi:hypothetical protein